MAERTHCPRCNRRLIYKRDGLFRWRACPAAKSCGWTVFVHGQDPRDGVPSYDQMVASRGVTR